ncbi:centrosomal protein of 63 kDa-like isoform X2 [Antedon mediterranea]|uniref:centrosomal protein of 63 kDa-like isoform X2 n=1 Tax=Antedon mediterranea TaxID=105859 RepID=UPI003AF546F9
MGEFEREAQRAGLFNGFPLSSCEAELQELMRQIDIMMAGRKKEWEMEIHALEARLDIKSKELNTSRSHIEIKHKELGQLRHNLQLAESSQQNITKQYDEQVSQLRNQLGVLQRDYERLQKHHSRQAATAQKTTDDKVEEASRLQSDLINAESTIKELEEKSKVWEGQRRVYRHQVESLESQRKTLAEKNQVLLQQADGYRSQLDKTRNMSEQQDYNRKSKLAYCETELKRTHDKLNERNNRILSLEGSLKDSIAKRMTVSDENLRLKSEIKNANLNIQRLEEDLNQLRVELQSRDDLLKASEHEARYQSRDVTQLQESLALKEDIIQTLKSQNKINQSVEQGHHASQMADKERENEQLRQNEKGLRDEVLRLQRSVDDASRECAHLNLELANKIDELSHLEGVELKELNDKYNKLSEKCSGQEDFFQSTLEGMKKEVTSLTTNLHERDKTVAYLKNKISLLQNQITDNNSKSEDGVSELQKENSLLRQHLNTLRHQVESGERNLQERLSSQKRESDLVIADMKEEEERKIEALNLEHHIEIQELKNRLSETVNQYEGELHNVKGPVSGTVTASSSYVRSPSRNKFFQNPNISQELLSFPELISQSDSFQYERPNSRVSVTSSFVAENKKHTNELEKLLNHHITDLENRTDETIGRYIPTSKSDT